MSKGLKLKYQVLLQPYLDNPNLPARAMAIFEIFDLAYPGCILADGEMAKTKKNTQKARSPRSRPCTRRPSVRSFDHANGTCNIYM